MADGGRSSFLNALGAESRRSLLSQARTLRARRGRTVLARGEHSSDVFILLEGRLNVVLYSPAGRQVSLRDLQEGDIFGELGAIDGERRSVSIVAASEARVLAASRRSFMAAIESCPEGAAWLMRHLTSEVRRLTERVFELSALNVQARLHCELLRLARKAEDSGNFHIIPAPTHAELADRIGTHREAVTRELQVLSQQRVIRSGRKRLEVLDINGLEVRVERAGLQTISGAPAPEG